MTLTEATNALRSSIMELPQPDSLLQQLLNLLEAVNDREIQILRIMADMTSALKPHLEDLGLSVAYLSFDLEATKRERDRLRQQLDGLTG